MLNLKLTIRNILRNKTYLVLNITGLSIAFAISIFILSYVIRETSFNRGFENYRRIARPVTIKKQFGWSEPSVSYPLHLKLLNDIPGIEAAAILRSVRSLNITKGEESIRIRNGFYSTRDILRIFTPEFIFADTSRFCSDPGSVFISESFAMKYFGEIPGPGEVVEAVINSRKENFTIDGVFRDFPVTSSFKPELLASFDLVKNEFPEGSFFYDFMDHWHKDIFREYILLDKSADFRAVSERVAALSNEQSPELNYEFALQPLKKVHLYSSSYVNDSRKGDFKFLLLFSAVAILILLIAISNYIILSIGSSSRRMPEIATRKIFGAKATSIRTFVLLESLLISMISLPLAFSISSLSGNAISNLFNISMELTPEGKVLLIILVIVLILLTGIISGSYLAARLGKIPPLFAVKRLSVKGGGSLLYKTLTTVQIVIFVSLLSASFIVLRQINYAKNIDPGYNSENLVQAEFPSGLLTDYRAFRYELEKNPNIKSLSFGSLLPPTRSAMVSIIKPADGGPDLRVEGISADFSFIETAGVEIIAGRDFNPDIASDSSAVIINSNLADKIGAREDNLHEIKSPGMVIGIMKDLQIHSVRDEIGPMTLNISKPKYISSLLVKVLPGKENEVLEFLREKFSEYDPLYFEAASYEESVKSMYGEEARFGTIVMVFGLIALLIAILGVFGLSLFLSNELRFSTAVYKVFGASVRDVVKKNTWRYLAYIGLGNIIAVPLVVILMNRWLQQFAFRTGISAWIFLAALLLSALVFVSTTFFNTMRLAGTNPVDNLRQA